MPWLLNAVYLALIAMFSPVLVWKALRAGKYRAGFAEKFLGRVPTRTSDRPCVWFHAVSMGEVNLLAPLIAELDRRLPQCECVISTTTLTGYGLARARYADRMVFYCPLDFSWAVRTAMRRLRPRLLVLAELELWPNLVHAARQSGVAVAVVNGRLSERSFRGYRWLRPFIRRLLAKIDLLAVQTPTYAQRFRALGAPAAKVHVTGSVKFDGAQTDRHNATTVQLRRLAGFASDDVVFLAGSTQDPEESMALAAFSALAGAFPRLRLIVVPRHPERFEAVARLIAATQLPWQRRSDLDRARPTSAARILLVDRMGELGAWWGTATVGFVGGSFGSRGGQNMIEPAAYGAAVCFGPRTHNFRDVVELLLEKRAAGVVHSEEDLTAFVRRAVAEPQEASAMGARAQSVVIAQQGATQRTIDLLEPLIRGGESAATAFPSDIGRTSAA